jgi:hypothetical protein
VSVGGVGIPRLQDLSYVEIAAGQLAAGATFEQVRRAIVTRAAETARDSDTEGSFNEEKWNEARLDTRKHVHNTVDVLKELMRLGWLDRRNLPAGPASAYLYSATTFSLTPDGEAWAELATKDRRAAYNELTGLLLATHPQFEGFLRVVGARPDSERTHLTVPLLRWNSAAHGNETGYLNAFIANVNEAVESGTLSWSAPKDTIDSAIRGYVGRIRARLDARRKPLARKQFVGSCEEAVTKLAFTAAGCPLDYVTMELLRRWTRFLGIANFSYYAPGPYALRFWSTGTVTGRGRDNAIVRRVGRDVRRNALEGLLAVWQERRAVNATEMYLPVWELRAAVCWRQRITDDEFDKSIAEALGGVHSGLGFRIHLDQASVRATPGSTRPLVLPTDSGVRRVFNIITIIPNTPKEQS